MPSEDRGDGGIEGFSTDGAVYQCYSPDAFLPIKDRREKQRDKLTEDVGKLIDKAAVIHDMVGEMKVSHYVYMVPKHDSKEINRHAKEQEARIRNANLPFIADDFVVLIVTNDDYPVENATVLNEGLGRLSLDAIEAIESAIEGFLEEDGGRVDVMTAKLSKVPNLNADRRNQMVGKFIDSYLRGQNAIDSLYDQHPAGYELLDEIRSAKEMALPFECEVATDTPLDLISRIRSEYSDSLSDELPFLRNSDATSIATSTVVEWLMDCPLDFHNV